MRLWDDAGFKAAEHVALAATEKRVFKDLTTRARFAANAIQGALYDGVGFETGLAPLLFDFLT